MKSVSRVIEEIKYIQQTLGASMINFTHDLLTFDKNYILDLCDRLEELPIPITWGASARIDTLDEEIVQRMRSAGCRGLFIGIEVGTDRMQKVIGKKLDLSKFLDVIGMLVSHNLPCTLSFIVGFPSEERNDIDALFSLLFKAKAMSFWTITTQIHTLTPEPGSKLLVENNNDLQMDEHGSPGTTSIPTHWNELRQLVNDNPRVFPSYLHFKSDLPRYSILMYAFLGELIEGPSNLSLRLAHDYLKGNLPSRLIEDIGELEVEVPQRFDSDRHEFMQEIKMLVSGYLEDDISKQRCYESLANYEIAINKILYLPIGSKNTTIEVWYDPLGIIDELESNRLNIEESVEQRKRVLLVFWDEERESVKYTELPKTLLTLIDEFQHQHAS
jgi:hypothetical protein